MIQIGTCSWTEKTLLQSREFYPRRVNTTEQRLRYYASVFDVVEVDSSYYAIPSQRTVQLWAERTPPDFIFHIKAYAPLTGHSTDLRSLPSEVRDMLPSAALREDRIFLKDRKALEATFEIFKETFRPLKDANKMGAVVFQYPPYFVCKQQNRDYILFCKDRMNGFTMAVEFRHGSWLTAETRESSFSFLRENGLSYITADEPQFGNLSTIPFIPEATTDMAYFRLHGRNRKTWLEKGIETSLRYDYLYSDEELKDFIPLIVTTAQKTKKTFVMFNNCHLGFAMRNGLRLKEMMRDREGRA
jgi:uncharacterized protein YecE (DUF72 family)